jgi:hypothetical protein
MIRLDDIWSIASPEQYKLHFARYDKGTLENPLEIWLRDKRGWQGWQEYRPKRNDFNREFIFSLVQFYHEPDIWLFGGVFRVLARYDDRYEVELTAQGEAFIGRLKLRSFYRERATRVNFENHYHSFELQEILREPYSGRQFSGFDEIDLSFEELETLVRNSRPDWQAALSSTKGIYLISDITTGKRYIGSAYGETGIWARWCAYIETGHGGNIELRALASDLTLEYCRKAFRFALLETRPASTPDDIILAREAYWKRILLTRGEFGLNRN